MSSRLNRGRLNDLESQLEEIRAQRAEIIRSREASTWARKLHPAQFERFDKFFEDFNERHPGLSGRAALIELSKDPGAIGLARQYTELLLEQLADRSGELQ